MSKSMEELMAEKEVLTSKLKAVNSDIDLLKSKTLVRCEPPQGCGYGFEIRELEYIQTHYYVLPRGCTEGDYWSPSEGQWKCPKCTFTNRLYNKPDIVKLKSLFKSVLDSYNR